MTRKELKKEYKVKKKALKKKYKEDKEDLIKEYVVKINEEPKINMSKEAPYFESEIFCMLVASVI